MVVIIDIDDMKENKCIDELFENTNNNIITKVKTKFKHTLFNIFLYIFTELLLYFLLFIFRKLEELDTSPKFYLRINKYTFIYNKDLKLESIENKLNKEELMIK